MAPLLLFTLEDLSVWHVQIKWSSMQGTKPGL